MKKLETINSAWRIETADKRKSLMYQSRMAGPTVMRATNDTGVAGEEGLGAGSYKHLTLPTKA